jgi:hypothetical protein
VVLGGALALGTTWFFEQRRERREDARERVALKAAARIAYTDMGVIRRNLRQAVKEGAGHERGCDTAVPDPERGMGEGRVTTVRSARTAG